MIRKFHEPKPILEKMYGDERDERMKRVCRCVDCRCLFTGENNDSVCGKCEKKPEIKNEEY